MREGARASQRMLVFELISAHAIITPTLTMPSAQFIVLGCCPPEKGSRGTGVVVGVRGAGKAHPGQVIICRLVPDPGGVRCSLGCPLGHSPWSRATMALLFLFICILILCFPGIFFHP